MEVECAKCGGNHKSYFLDCSSRKRIIEARIKQLNGGVLRSWNSPVRIINNSHFSVNICFLKNQTHQKNYNHAHSQANFLPSGDRSNLFNSNENTQENFNAYTFTVNFSQSVDSILKIRFPDPSAYFQKKIQINELLASNRNKYSVLQNTSFSPFELP